jgi:hypothetical protein
MTKVIGAVSMTIEVDVFFTSHYRLISSADRLLFGDTTRTI